MAEQNLQIPDHFYRVSIKALVLDNEKRFLLVKEENGLWEFPGGGLNYNESPEECLKREIKEEMRLEVSAVSEKPCYFIKSQHRSGKLWMANVFYETKIKDFNFKSSSECIELRFFTKDETEKENLYPNVKEFIRKYNPNNHNNF